MSRMKSDEKLTPRQKAFCEEYVANNYKLVDAYMKAFKCSYETANANQWKLMKKQAIKDYISEIQRERFEALGMNANRIAKMLTDIATDPQANRNEQMKALELLQKQMGLQTQKVEADVKTTTIKIEIEDGD